jgi:hypothetical protein
MIVRNQFINYEKPNTYGLMVWVVFKYLKVYW